MGSSSVPIARNSAVPAAPALRNEALRKTGSRRSWASAGATSNGEVLQFEVGIPAGIFRSNGFDLTETHEVQPWSAFPEEHRVSGGPIAWRLAR
jgi:hypothetical protein